MKGPQPEFRMLYFPLGTREFVSMPKRPKSEQHAPKGHELQSREQTWDALQKELSPAMRADDREFTVVSAEDVIHRNQQR